MTRRLAVWSGPRNISTAMMYAFGCRPDCVAVDEPFYAAHWSDNPQVTHPLRAEVLGAQPTDPAKVLSGLDQITAPLIYEKHMCHHIGAEWPLDWMLERQNVFLIRHPARVIASYSAKDDHPTLDAIGFPQQLRLYRWLVGQGATPLVADSAAIRQNPEAALRRICQSAGTPFDPDMLTWPAGPKTFDGVWASHWYDAVHRSTGFAGPEGPQPELTGAQSDLLDRALPIYEELRAAIGPE